MRDKLIEILTNSEIIENCFYKKCKDCKYENIKHCTEERIIDYLLSQGILISPVEVGDHIYIVDETIDEYEVQVIKYENFDFILIVRECFPKFYNPNMLKISCKDFGKDVFKTRKEAEEKLEGK